GHRCEVCNRIVAERAIKAAIDREGSSSKQHRVAVRIGAGDQLIANVGAGASPVLDYDLLAPDLRELLGEDAGDDVGRSSGGKGHNETHDSMGPIERLPLRPPGTAAKAGHECGTDAQSNQAAAREHGKPLSWPRALAHLQRPLPTRAAGDSHAPPSLTAP